MGENDNSMMFICKYYNKQAGGETCGEIRFTEFERSKMSIETVNTVAPAVLSSCFMSVVQLTFNKKKKVKFIT